jgi:hypothetical protein
MSKKKVKTQVKAKAKIKKPKAKRAYKKKNLSYWKTTVFKVRNARPDVQRKKAKIKKAKANKGKR